MLLRSEGAEVPENTLRRGAKRAEAYLTVRRARGASTQPSFRQIGSRSSKSMNNLG
jgi:hypothetical protein